MQKLALLLVLALFANLSHAGIINGDFEDGDLNGWTVSDPQYVTLTAPNNGFESVYGVDFNATDFSNVSTAGLESFFNLTSNTLANADFCISINCIAGQGMTQTVTVEAGDSFSFEWFSETSNGDPGLEFDDFDPNDGFVDYMDAIFFVAEGAVHFVTDGETLANQNMSVSHFKESYTFTTSGTFDIGFGIINGGEDGVQATMKVDNVEYFTAEVPEPGTLALFALALLTLNLRRK